MIAVINYGMGNTGSILNMLKKIGADALAADTPEELRAADKIILPGVGTFDNGMEKLEAAGLCDAIKEATLKDRKPFLGICLGMQLLGTRSEEGTREGLGLIDFECSKFDFNDMLDGNQGLKVPHMGWDIVKFCKNDSLLDGIEETQRYYFVHSYYAKCKNKDNVLMTCDYGVTFSASVVNENIYGVQFHPEKSHKFGMHLLENFVRRV